MAIDVRVLLNQSEGNFRGYRNGATLSEVAVFELPEELVSRSVDGVPVQALELVFRELNVDTPTAEWALRYRLNRNRSLSVGDVVIVGGVAYAVESCGWDLVALVAEQVINRVGESYVG